MVPDCGVCKVVQLEPGEVIQVGSFASIQIFACNHGTSRLYPGKLNGTGFSFSFCVQTEEVRDYAPKHRGGEPMSEGSMDS